jgi:hypothetical protein
MIGYFVLSCHGRIEPALSKYTHYKTTSYTTNIDFCNVTANNSCVLLSQ